MKRIWCFAAAFPIMAIAPGVGYAVPAEGINPSEPEPAVILTMKPMLTLEAAHIVAQAGLDEAGRLSAGGAIAVTDDAGSLV